MTPEERIKELELEVKVLKESLEAFKTKPHPVTGGNYTFAFEIDGKKYYKWEKEEDIPLSRKLYINGFVKATNLTIEGKDFKQYIQDQYRMLLSGQVDTAKQHCLEILGRMQEVALPKLIFRIMALCYFEEGEDLKKDLPSDILESRAELFWKKKEQTLQEIFTPPIAPILSDLKFFNVDMSRSLKEMEEFLNNLMAHQIIADQRHKTIMELTK